MTVSRRRLLSTAAPAAFAAAGVLGIARPAKAAWVAIILAVASFVASRIAAHNQRDTTALVLSSAYRQLRVHTMQLASVQLGLAYLIEEVAKLPEAMSERLVSLQVTQLHQKLKAAAFEFEFQRSSLEDYGYSEQNWLDEKHRRDNLKEILSRLRTKRGELLQTDYPIDPAAALVMTTAAIVELSLLNLLEYSTSDALRLIALYEDYFRKVKDPREQASVAAYIQQHARQRREVDEKIGRDPLMKEIEAGTTGAMYTPTTPSGTCAAIDDYRAPYSKLVFCREAPSGVDNFANAPPACHEVYQDYPARQGLQYQLSVTAQVRDIPAEEDIEAKIAFDEAARRLGTVVQVGDSQLWLRTLDLGTPELEMRTKGSFWQSGVACRMEKMDLPSKTSEERIKQLLLRSKDWKSGSDAIAALTSLFQAYNLESARISYGQNVLSAVDATLTTLNRLRESYK